jgi:hypothetical protein
MRRTGNNMDFEFGYNEDAAREFLPKYGGIDWHQRWLEQHDNKDNWSVWGEAIDDLGEFCEQLSQENCAFYLNETDKDFDILVVLDHRDDSADFWWCRYQLGNEEFEHLLDKLDSEVTVIFSKYPMEQCVSFVLGVMGMDLDKGIPDEWGQ